MVTDVENKLIQKTNLWGKGGGGINWETGIDIHTTIYKIDN